MEGVILLADPNSRAWDFSLKIKKYMDDVKEDLIPLEPVLITTFRNGEVGIHVPRNIRKKHIYFIHDSTKDPQQWWVELLLLKDLLLSASAESVSFVLPDILYSRQDRKDRPHVPISARALANSISPGLKRIITMELHASQIQGFYPDKLPLDNLYSFPDAVKHFREHHLEDLKKLVLVSPDAGGAERTRSFLQRLIRAQRENNEDNEYSFALISKIRPSAGEIEEMRLVGDVKDKNCLIVDDIIDSGTTLCKAAELLKESGAKKIFAYATHGIFSKGTEELLKNFDAIMTSNTHSIENHRVEVIDVSGVFAEAIYRDIKGHSISKLFE